MVSPKNKISGQESTLEQRKNFEKFLRGMSVHQKLGIILENKVVQKFWHFLTNRKSSTDFFKKNPLSMLILGQKSCFLGPTIFEIPQPN